jgi:hypothetical protein
MVKSDVASEILAYCTSCKMDLNHLVVALKSEKIAKVQCLTCKKEHTYKKPKGISEASEKPAPRTKKAKVEVLESHPIEIEWEKLMQAHKDVPTKSYQMYQAYHLGEKIKHSKFGEGIVERLIYPNKIEVIFKHSIKVLVHMNQ